MPEPRHLKLKLPAQQFDVSLLPVDARQTGTAAFDDSATIYLNREFDRFGGSASIRVENGMIEVDWTTEREPADALPQIIDQLKRGKYAAAITLLRLFSSLLPNDANLLYNLGMALSDSGKLKEAISDLRRAVTIAPDFTNARVALGIALGRHGESEDAMRVLDEAVAGDRQNAWART
jgi:Flp pilus assembly protein TadD